MVAKLENGSKKRHRPRGKDSAQSCASCPLAPILAGGTTTVQRQSCGSFAVVSNSEAPSVAHPFRRSLPSSERRKSRVLHTLRPNTDSAFLPSRFTKTPIAPGRAGTLARGQVAAPFAARAKVDCRAGRRTSRTHRHHDVNQSDPYFDNPFAHYRPNRHG
jgi:hypothetical protein